MATCVPKLFQVLEIQWSAIMIIILHLFFSEIWGVAFFPGRIFLYYPLKYALKSPLSPDFEKSKIHQLWEAVDNFEWDKIPSFLLDFHQKLKKVAKNEAIWSHSKLSTASPSWWILDFSKPGDRGGFGARFKGQFKKIIAGINAAPQIKLKNRCKIIIIIAHHCTLELITRSIIITEGIHSSLYFHNEV